MNIWLIMHGEPLPVIANAASFRTARLSRQFASRGHEVTFWCSSFEHHKKELYCHETCEVVVDDYNLHILHAGKYRSNHSLGRYLHHKRMAKLFAEEALKKRPPDVIIAGLPIHYCAYEAVRLGKRFNIPVIVDIRDYWPDIYLMLFPKRLAWLGRLIFKNDFTITKLALRDATALVSMMSQMLEWAAAEYADRELNSDDRVFFIGGDSQDSENPGKWSQLFPELDGRVDERFVVNYIGSFSFLNHPMVLVEAAKHLNANGHKDDILFLLAGHGDYHESCVRAAEGLDNVVFLGWVNAEGLTALNSVTSVGVIPSHEEFSFPNKAFAYLGAGLPILSSEHGDLNRLLEEYNAGLHYDISDSVDLAQKILDLSRLDKESYREVSKNARTLFENHLRADKIYEQYADYVEHIVTKYGTRETE